MTTAAPAARHWSLQSRLMIAVIGIVSLIVVIIALTTGAILGTILQQNLLSSLKESASRIELSEPGFPVGTRDAVTILTESHAEPGFLLVVNSAAAGITGAYVDADREVRELDGEQLHLLASLLTHPANATVTVPELGDFLLAPIGFGPTTIVGLAGVSTTELSATVAQILTTVALVTAGGLLILSAAIALIVRVGLRPLRSVADTAERVARLPMTEGDVTIAERVPSDQADEHTDIGRVGHALNTLLDHVDASLSERQRNEERMRHFVADASHELRTPLASIRGYSELSLRSAALPSDTRSALERIQAQSLRMTGLVEDLLLLARLDEGQELVYGVVDLTRLVLDAVGDARVAGQDHVWRLEVGDEPISAAGDQARLQQVLSNLLANARTHTPPGTTVTVHLTRDGSDAVLRVHDDGPGIDPAIAGELFERFARADRSRARKTGGTGLGLSIARAIVTAHRGSLTVHSEPGDTTFTVRLPARPADPRTGDDEPELDAAEASRLADSDR